MNISIPRLLVCLLLFTFAPGVRSLYAGSGWEFQTSGMIKGKATISDDIIYVAGGQVLYALDMDGKLIWQKDMGATVAARVSLVEGVLYVHSAAGVHAIDIGGEQTWFFPKQDKGPLVAGQSWGWGDETLADPWGWYRSSPLVRE